MTNSPVLARQMEQMRSHGITRDPFEMTHEPEGPWFYQQLQLGYNYRMTDIQAALGLSQMQRLDAFVSKRHAIARRYDGLLANLPLITPFQIPACYSALHLYVIRLKLKDIRKSHREVFEALRMAGVGVNLHYIPVYRHPYFERMGFKAGYCPEAERYYSEAITLPIYSNLTEEQQLEVVEKLTESIGYGASSLPPIGGE